MFLMSNYKALRQTTQLDADVNLVTYTRKGQRQVRETDGRLVKTKFNVNRDSAAKAARQADWDRQIAEYGTVLFA